MNENERTNPGIGIVTGIDVVDVNRIGALISRWGDRFLNRCFTKSEMTACQDRTESIAARIAAKEACAKALGTGLVGFGWQDIEVVSDANRSPGLKLRGGARTRSEQNRWFSNSLSIAHQAGITVAVVVVLISKG